MNSPLSDRVNSIQPSATLTISAKAAELRAEGKTIISLSSGEPDFNTPQPIIDAAIKAMNEGQTKYTPVDGTRDLKNNIIEKFKRENHLDYAAHQILVSNGAKQSLFNLFQAILNPGDEVIIFAPYWVSYPDMVALTDAKPIIIQASIAQNFKVTPEQLKQAITDKTKCIILNSPSNPTGVAYTQEELKALGEVIAHYPKIIIASDDIYEHILWGQDQFVNIVNACPELYDQTVVINGVSKAYAMTGWRIGYAAGPQKIIAAMKKIQGQSTSNACSISQAAASAALASGTSLIGEMQQAFHERHDYMVKALNDLKGFNCIPADGTFYAFPDVSGVVENGGFNSDVDLAESLLEKAGVATVPGTAFGAPGYLRLSYALGMEDIQQAVQQIKDFLV